VQFGALGGIFEGVDGLLGEGGEADGGSAGAGGSSRHGAELIDDLDGVGEFRQAVVDVGGGSGAGVSFGYLCEGFLEQESDDGERLAESMGHGGADDAELGESFGLGHFFSEDVELFLGFFLLADIGEDNEASGVVVLIVEEASGGDEGGYLGAVLFLDLHFVAYGFAFSAADLLVLVGGEGIGAD